MTSTTEPKTVRDVWYMLETSSRCVLDREQITEPEDYIAGCVMEKEIRVYVPSKSSKAIYVQTYENICHSHDAITHATSYSSQEVDRITYNSIEEFKASEYYEDFLRKYADGKTDSSWIDDMEINYEDGLISVTGQLGVTREDWLNKGWFKTSKQHEEVYITVNQVNGVITIDTYLGDFDFVIEDLYEMMQMKQFMKDNHIVIDNNKLSISFDNEGKNV